MPRIRPTRRQVLQWAAAGSAWLLAPACHDAASTGVPDGGPTGATTPQFFTDDERSMLSALADVALPPDDGFPGGSELGMVPFMEQMLTAFDGDGTPRLYASGPNSDRNRIPNPDGTAGPRAENDFLTPQPLDRVSIAAWKLYLFGGDGPNGKVVGLRDQMKSQLQASIAALGKSPSALNVAEKARAFAALPVDFQNQLIELTAQAAWAAPEYGGNTGLLGWRLVFFEGDVQPFGYTQWDALTQQMIEQPRNPVSTANPQADPVPLDDDTRQLLTTLVQLLGGRVFY